MLVRMKSTGSSHTLLVGELSSRATLEVTLALSVKYQYKFHTRNNLNAMP